ncbi:MAG: T9SS type A sorting domain-containing protein [Flavobacteriales bacterium]|nr:T9SS type A sorting domain-containing protein [Flavobacteriales bacterium]
MKKITLIISLTFGLFAQAQTAESAVSDSQVQQINFVNTAASPNATVFLHDIGVTTTANGNAGVVFLNNQFWVSRWASADLNVLDSSGAFVETFQVAGVTGTRGMTTDGTNVYISNNTASISIVDPVTKTLTGTIPVTVTPATNIRYVTYDASLNGGSGGFWVGNFNTDFFAISMTGAQLSSIPASTHTATGVYGLALDSTTNTLYAYAQMAPSNDVIIPVSLPSGTPGVAYDVFANDLSVGGTTSSLAGGIFVSNQVISGQSTIIGVSQATPSNILFGINTITLSNTNFDSNEFSVYPNPANTIVTISSSNITLDNVEMTDLNGRVVKSINLGGVSNSEISIADLATGIYLLKINSNNGTITKKLIVE